MRFCWLLIIIGTLSACSLFSSDKVNKPEPLYRLTPNISLKERWQQDVGRGLGELYRVVKPVINNTTVFANDIDGRIYAFNRETGEQKWNKRLRVDMASGVGIGANRVFAGSLNGDVIALSQSDGEELWRVNISGEILAPPQTNGQVVVVQTNEGKLYGLSLKDGSFLWRYTTKLPLLTIRGTATPVLFGNNLMAGFANGKLVALSAEDGTLFWERRIAYPRGRTEIDRVVDVDGTPTASGSTVYATSYNGALTAIGPDGRIRWTQRVSSHQSPLVIGKQVFITDSDGVLRAYEAATGFPLWDNGLLLHRQVSAPQNVGGFVVVSDYKGYIHVFDPELGLLIGRSRFDRDGIRSPMVTDGTYLYALGNDGELFSISLHLRGVSKSAIEAAEEAERLREERDRETDPLFN